MVLLDPLISASDIALWQHRTVLMSLLVQGRPKLALKYARIRRPPMRENVDRQLQVQIMPL